MSSYLKGGAHRRPKRKRLPSWKIVLPLMALVSGFGLLAAIAMFNTASEIPRALPSVTPAPTLTVDETPSWSPPWIERAPSRAERRTRPPSTYVPVPPRTPSPRPTETSVDLDPRFDTCREAREKGYGPYRHGVDEEYTWYVDRDRDGIVCEAGPSPSPTRPSPSPSSSVSPSGSATPSASTSATTKPDRED